VLKTLLGEKMRQLDRYSIDGEIEIFPVAYAELVFMNACFSRRKRPPAEFCSFGQITPALIRESASHSYFLVTFLPAIPHRSMAGPVSGHPWPQVYDRRRVKNAKAFFTREDLSIDRLFCGLAFKQAT
jgi:hypothetical protein